MAGISIVMNAMYPLLPIPGRDARIKARLSAAPQQLIVTCLRVWARSHGACQDPGFAQQPLASLHVIRIGDTKWRQIYIMCIVCFCPKTVQ